jgi:hypothetical protein
VETDNDSPPPTPSLRHLALICDANGIFEHALLDQPRREIGYCTDDAGRLLGVATRLPWDPDSARLTHVALGFLERAHLGEGTFRLRQRPSGEWTDDPPSDDANARALLGLATAAAWSAWPHVRSRALELFDRASALRSPHPRATAYAALGAAELLAAFPDHPGALRLARDASNLVGPANEDGAWRWPEPRLSYANALLPEAALAVANALGDQRAANDALGQLDWLVNEELLGDHFSFTPVGGRGPNDTRPAFDQQPIEAWAMCEACARAHDLTGDARWADSARRAASWFLGGNDLGLAMFDPATGGGFDGLGGDGVNRNEGAESSMAYVAAMTVLQRIAAQCATAPEEVEPSRPTNVLQAASNASSR